MTLQMIHHIRRGLPVLLGAVVLATSACRAPLPRLQQYGNDHANQTEWNLGENGDADSTINRLSEHSDRTVRAHAESARKELDELADRRTARRTELLDADIDEIALVGEVALIEVDTTQLPTELNSVDLHEALAKKAMEAEEEGRIGEALKLANAAIAVELVIPYRFEDSLSETNAREIMRRTGRRLDLIQLVDPQLANRLLDTGAAEPGAPEDAAETHGSGQSRSRTAALANATALIELMHQNHVDKPEIADMHRAGIEEVLAVTEILSIHGHDDAEALARRIENGDLDLESTRTMTLLTSLDRMQEESASSTLPSKFAIRAFVEGAAGALDQRTSVVWPDEFARYMRQAGRRYRGIGTSVQRRPDGTVTLEPLPGGPASRAGVQAGDRVVEIAGTSVRDLSLEELTLIATDPKRSNVELLLERGPEDAHVRVVIELGVVIRPHTTGWKQSGLAGNGLPTWDWLADPGTRIAYVRLDGFRAGGDRAIRLALQAAQFQANEAGGRLEGLILDLRRNGGGQVSIAEEIANLFVREGTIFRSTDGQEQLDDDRARKSHAELAGMPLVILVDERSASASELVAGMLQARANALIIGDRTYGKGSIQTPLRAFTDDCMVLVTTGWYLLPPRPGDDSDEWRFVDRAKTPRGWGVQPDVQVPMSAEETNDALAFRTRWYSGVGPDVAPLEATMKDPPLDPAVELAIALLRARIVDARSNDLSARALSPR